MKGQTHHYALSVRRMLLLIVLGCLLAGSLAGALFQSSSAAQGESLRLNPKHGPSAPTFISETQTWQGDLTEARHPLAAQVGEQLHAAPEASGYVIESDGSQSHCRTATEEEARAMQQRDPELQFHAITHEESA